MNIKQTIMEKVYDERNPKEVPLALALIEAAEKQGATVHEFFQAMDRAKLIVRMEQNISLSAKLQSYPKSDL